MIRKIEHIGIAVRSIEKSLKLYEGLFKMQSVEILEIPERGVRAAMIDAGNMIIELLEPMGDDSGMAKFLDKKGEGIHHIAFGVTDIEDALENLRAMGIELVTPEPYRGAHGRKVVFLSPKSCSGVLIELCEIIEE